MNSDNESVCGPLTIFRRSAMASDFEVFLNAQQSDNQAEIAILALDEIDRIEDILSIFRPTSLLSRINFLAAEISIPLESEVFQWFQQSRELWEKTGGAFDLTCTPLWKVWGFAKRQGKLPQDDELKKALSFVGMNHVILDESSLTIAFDQEGIEVNFGGIGKGIALDQAAMIFEANQVSDFMIHGGKSSIIAHGSRSGDMFRRNHEKIPCWTVGVMNPLLPNVRLAELYLVDQAVGTSGSMQQFFRHKGKKWAHIIDPKTGIPVNGILSTTVIAPTAAEADALSTAFFIFGPEKAKRFCERYPEYSALFIMETTQSPHYEIVPVNIENWNRVEMEADD